MPIEISLAADEDKAGLTQVYLRAFKSERFMVLKYPGVCGGDEAAVNFLDMFMQRRISNMILDPTRWVMKATDTDTLDNPIVGLCIWISSQDWSAWEAQDNNVEMRRLISNAPSGVEQETLLYLYGQMESKLKLHMRGKRFWCEYLHTTPTDLSRTMRISTRTPKRKRTECPCQLTSSNI
jgi:hypothetical protein